ncbi:DUF3408 domain-containing protein [Alistipes timonensis]|uniref:DUF3408 domain-containing protein n=1 Tax=Alistipes timonensis TaxID=1465754 RepID=UPI00266F1A8C|nr:DUF3408 domain-containing protein [Alistipes timonensis]
MDSLEEKDKPAPKLSKRPRIEVDEELMRQMIAGQAPLDSKVVRRIPEPEEGAEKTAQEPIPKSEVDESSPSVVPAAVAAGKDAFGFRRKKLTLPDFERTFFAPVDCPNRSAIYVSTQTKGKVSAILYLLGNEHTRLTALVDNMLRFVMDIYNDELNYLHEKKNNRRPF